MPVRKFTQPDYTTKAADQAGFESYCAEIEAALTVLNASPLGQFSPYASTPPDMRVNVRGGLLRHDLGIATGVQPQALIWTGRTMTAAAPWRRMATDGEGVVVALAVGALGTSLNRSADRGATWAGVSGGTSNYWSDVCYAGDGVYVAVAGNHSAYNSRSVQRSTDNGQTWATDSTALPQALQWLGVASDGAGVVVAVASNASIAAVSTDFGVTWQSRSLGSNLYLRDVAYCGGGRFAAIGGTAFIGFAAISNDWGQTWSLATTPPQGGPIFDSVEFNDGVLVAAALEEGGSQTAKFSVSYDDGDTWVTRTVPDAGYWGQVAVGQGLFLVPGSTSGNGKAYLLTRDGKSWKLSPQFDGTVDWRAAAYCADRFVTAALSSTKAATSPWLPYLPRFSAPSILDLVAQQTGDISAPVSAPRIDRVGIYVLDGSLMLLGGAEAASPSAPPYPDGVLPVCQVALAVGQAVITNAHITDERGLINTDSPACVTKGDITEYGAAVPFAFFGTPGAFNFPKPAGATFFRISMGGAAGGRGGAYVGGYGGGGGGGGGVITSGGTTTNGGAVMVADDLTIVVGAAGANGADGSPGTDGGIGGTTTVTGVTSGIVMTATGGGKGFKGAAASGGTGGAAGTVTPAGLGFSGQAGGTGAASQVYGSPGKAGELQFLSLPGAPSVGAGNGCPVASDGWVLIEWW